MSVKQTFEDCTNKSHDYLKELKKKEKEVNPLSLHFYRHLIERSQNIKCPNIHLPLKQFECNDYNELLNINDEKINDKSDEKNENYKNTKSIHICHISDTHMRHNDFDIPYKKDAINILIHTGDFGNKAKLTKNNEIPKQIYEFALWFKKQPHQKKVIIAGNQEIAFNYFKREQIQKYIFKQEDNIYYLQDESVKLYGINIYGSPWTCSYKMGFSANKQLLKEKWKMIPSNTHILLTHLPPLGIMDTVYKNNYNFTNICNMCQVVHQHYKHWGNLDLLNEITNRIKPRVHLFGHVHSVNAHQTYKDVVFINSAMDLIPIAHEFDVIFDK
eukprot:416246_1